MNHKYRQQAFKTKSILCRSLHQLLHFLISIKINRVSYYNNFLMFSSFKFLPSTLGALLKMPLSLSCTFLMIESSWQARKMGIMYLQMLRHCSKILQINTSPNWLGQKVTVDIISRTQLKQNIVSRCTILVLFCIVFLSVLD